MANNEEAKLMGQVSDGKITNSSPGEITLNAKNLGNKTSFHVRLRPKGDYSKIAKVTDRQGQEILELNLGSAVKDATTGQQFAQVRKRLNVSSTVKIKAELYNETGNKVLDQETYVLKAIES